MAKVLIGNFKGPKGDKGDKGDRGPQGPKGEQGPVGLVNADAAIEFEDYTTSGVEVPTPEVAMAEIVSGKSLKGIISNIKAFFKGVVTLGMIVNNLDDVLAVEDGTVLPVGCKALQEVSAKIGKNFSLMDLNNIKETCSGYATSCTNRPTESNGFLEVISMKQGSNILTMQRYTVYGSFNTYARIFSSGKWESWVKVI